MRSYDLSAMSNVANNLESYMAEWHSKYDELYAVHSEIDAMWDGEASDEFNRRFVDEDKPKYEQLYSSMEAILTTLRTAIEKYSQMEQDILNIMK